MTLNINTSTKKATMSKVNVNPAGKPMMVDINQLVNERQRTHGGMQYNSEWSQRLKAVIRDSDRYEQMEHYKSEALDMICHKIGRILAGDSSYLDHWDDIAGYATAVGNILRERQTPPQ